MCWLDLGSLQDLEASGNSLESTCIVVYVFGTFGQPAHFWQAMGSHHTASGTWCHLSDTASNTVIETCKACEALQRA